MASENISFTEELIPEVIEVIRNGILYTKVRNPAVRRAIKLLREQCDELERYWKDNQE